MTRYVLTKAVVVPAVGYSHPGRTLPRGSVVELSDNEVTVIAAAGGNVRTTTARDALGLSAGASN